MCDIFAKNQGQFEQFADYALQKTKQQNVQPQNFFSDLYKHLQSCMECQQKFSTLLVDKIELPWKLCWMMYFLSGKSMDYAEIATRLGRDADSVRQCRMNTSVIWSWGLNRHQYILQQPFICPHEKELQHYFEKEINASEWSADMRKHITNCSMCYTDVRLYNVLISQRSEMNKWFHQQRTNHQQAKQPTWQMAIPIPENIEQYKIINRIGKGGMGEVYEAVDTKLGRKVAIKTIISPNQTSMIRFVQEAKLMAQFNHPNIVQIYEIIEKTERNICYLVMEYIEGSTLKGYVQKNDLSMLQFVKLFKNIALALKIIHDRNIIHRDLKPENIMINNNDELKIMDFGIAKAQEESHNITQPNAMIGTILYMSPEQINNDNVGKETDIWALGVIFYYLLTKQQPFQKDQQTKFNVINNIMNSKPVPLQEYNANIPKKLQNICIQMLNVDRSKRYSAQDLSFALEQLEKEIGDEKILTSSNNKTSKNRNRGKQNKKPFSLYIGSILVVVVIAVLFLLQPSVITQPRVFQNGNPIKANASLLSHDTIVLKTHPGAFTYIFQADDKDNKVEIFPPTNNRINIYLSQITSNQDWYILNSYEKLDQDALNTIQSQVFERGVNLSLPSHEEKKISNIKCNMFYKTSRGFQPLANLEIDVPQVLVKLEIRPKQKARFVSLAKCENKVTEGDLMRFSMSSKQNLYAAIFLKDGKNNVSRLYPIETDSQQVLTDKVFIFPDKNIHGVEGFPFDNVKGLEQIYYFHSEMMFTEQKLQHLQKCVQEITPTDIERGVNMKEFGKSGSIPQYHRILFEHY